MRTHLLRRADHIFIEELRRADLYGWATQTFKPPATIEWK